MTSSSGSVLPDLDQSSANNPVLAAPTSSRAGLAVAVGVSATVMLAVGLWGLDRGSMWRDEVATYVVAQRTVPQLWAMLHNVDAVHGLYYLGMHAWLTLGDGEVWLRVPSVAASVVSAGLVAGLGTRLGGVRAGLSAGLLFATMPVVSNYAQEAGSFALVSAAVLAATCLLVLALDRGGKWWPAYAAMVTLAAVMNEIAALALVAHAVTLWILRVPRRAWWRWTGCAAICGMTLLPVAWITFAQSGQVDWLRAPDLDDLGNLAQLLLAPHPVTLAVMVALVIAGVVLARPAAGLELAAVAAPLAFVPPVLLLLVSFAHPLFHPRYVLYSVAGMPLLAALGLVRLTSWLGWDKARGRVRHGAGIVAIAAILLGVAVTGLPQQRLVRTRESRPDDLAAAAAVIRLHARPGDPVVFMPSTYRLIAMGYPVAFRGLSDPALDVSPAESSSLTGRELEIPQITAAMLSVDHVWVVGRPRLIVFPEEEKTMAKQAVLRTHFRRVQIIRVHGVDVTLYRRTGP